MKICMKKFVLLLPFFASVTPTFGADVFGSDPFMIHVTPDESTKTVRFELCPAADPAHCEPIGQQSKFGEAMDYRISDLQKQLEVERRQYVISVGAQVYATAALATAAPLVLIFPGVIASVIAIDITALLMTDFYLVRSLDKVNPVIQRRQMLVLQEEVYSDRKVILSGSVRMFAAALSTVLHKLPAY